MLSGILVAENILKGCQRQRKFDQPISVPPLTVFSLSPDQQYHPAIAQQLATSSSICITCSGSAYLGSKGDLWTPGRGTERTWSRTDLGLSGWVLPSMAIWQSAPRSRWTAMARCSTSQLYRRTIDNRRGNHGNQRIPQIQTAVWVFERNIETSSCMLCFIVCLLGQQVAKKPRIEECLPRMNVTVLGDRGTWNILELEFWTLVLYQFLMKHRIRWRSTEVFRLGAPGFDLWRMPRSNVDGSQVENHSNGILPGTRFLLMTNGRQLRVSSTVSKVSLSLPV